MIKKLLVTGISGFVGSHLGQIDTRKYEITGIAHSRKISLNNINCITADLSDAKQVEASLSDVSPDAVIHLAALSNPNYCEQYPAASQSMNVDLPILLAEHCQRLQIPFLFSSTDLVFDGNNAAYRETDAANPICIYGQHKLLAERRILELYPNSTIARLPLMFGLSTQGGFMQHWIQQMNAGKTVFAFTDEFRTPISASCALEGMLLLLEKECTGCWHLGGQESISRYDLASLIVENFSLSGAFLKASKQKDVQLPAARPANVSLNSDKAFGIGFKPKTIQQALQELRLQTGN